MRMSQAIWMVSGVVLGAIMWFVIRGRIRRSDTDLGTISDQWIAQQRAQNHDPAH